MGTTVYNTMYNSNIPIMIVKKVQNRKEKGYINKKGFKFCICVDGS